MDNNKNKNVVIFENRKIPMTRVVNESLESSSSEAKEYVFEGVCAVFEGKNNNSRYYDRTEYLRLIEALQPEIEQNSLAGSLDHPDDDEDSEKDIFTPKMKDLSHLITKLWYKPETDEVWVRIKLLDTEWGKNAKACVDAGMPLYISSRASGFIDDDGRVWLSQIHTYDIVYRPGFKDAKLNPVLESHNGKNSFFSVISRQRINENEMDEQIMENKVYKVDELSEEKVLELISSGRPSATEFMYDVVNILPELYDYPKFIDYLVDESGDEQPFMLAIVDYFMECGRYVYEDTGVSCENISDFINIEVARACRDYLAEIKSIFRTSFGDELEIVNENKDNDLRKYRKIVESMQKSKNGVIRKIRSVNECSSAKHIVADFCLYSDNDADKLEVIDAFCDVYPSELDTSVLTEQELILLATDWKNEQIYCELDGLHSTVADVRRDIHKLQLGRQEDYSLSKRHMGEMVKNINTQFAMMKDDISILYGSISDLRHDLSIIVGWFDNVENNVSLTSSEITALKTSLRETSNAIQASVDNIHADHASLASQVTAIEEDMSLVAESNNKIKKSMRQKINESKLSSASSLSSRVDALIEQAKSSATEFKIFESDGTLTIPNRYKKKYESLNENQKFHIASVLENKNPRTKSEYFAIWESFGL